MNGRVDIADTVDPCRCSTDPTAPTLDPAEAAEIETLRTPERIGRFQLLDVLGEGGMGRVYAAYDQDLDRRVALKVLRGAEESPEQTQRIRREAHAMARISHPNVAQIYDVGEHRGQTWIAMEYVDGVPLAEWQAEHRAWPEVLGMYTRVGAGLAAAHAAGMMHRDFKPQNVLVGHDGRPRIIDFGLARAELDPAATEGGPPPTDAEGVDSGDLLASPLTLAGSVVGTPAYMAPEQIRGEPVGPACDQFAFAVALYEALDRAPPFAGRGLQARLASIESGALRPLGGGVPSGVAEAINRALSADPERRWPSMQALLDGMGWDPYDDRGVGVRRRLLFFVGLTLVTGATMAFGLWARLDAMPDIEALMISDCAGLLVLLGLAWLFRRRIGSTAHSRRLSAWLLLTVGSPLFTRSVALINGFDPMQMLSVDLMAMTSLAALAGFLVARWAFWTALTFAAGSTAVALTGEAAPLAFATTIFLAIGTAVIGTWREARSVGIDPMDMHHRAAADRIDDA